MKKKNIRSVAPKSGRPEKINGRARAALIILALCLVSCFFAGVAAKYFSERGFDGNEIKAQSFYFTVDLMGDTNSAQDLQRTIDVYGGNKKELSFNVQNYFDDKRVTDGNIKYTVSIDAGKSTHAGCSLSSSGTELTLTGGAKASKKFTLTIPEGYKNNDTVAVKIASSAPYEKELTLVFELHTYEAVVSYRIEDEAKSNVAALIIMVEEDIGKGDIAIDWSGVKTRDGLAQSEKNIFQVDLTNTYIMDAGLDFSGGYLQSASVSKDLKAGESIMIYFFKIDTEADYSMPNTAAEMSGSTYSIILSGAGGENE